MITILHHIIVITFPPVCLLVVYWHKEVVNFHVIEYIHFPFKNSSTTYPLLRNKSR